MSGEIPDVSKHNPVKRPSVACMPAKEGRKIKLSNLAFRPNCIIPFTVEVSWRYVDFSQLFVGDDDAGFVVPLIQRGANFEACARCCTGDEIYHGLVAE